MSIALLLVIATPMMLAFVTSVRYIGKTDEKFTDTRGALLSAAYFSSDVASSGTITLNDSSPCGGTGTGITAVVSFNWTDSSVSTTYKSSWILDASKATNQQLRRKVCLNGSSTPTSQSVPAVYLGGAPVVSCYDPGNVADATCSTSTRWVKMVITTAADSPTPDTPSPPLVTFTLEGTRRSTK